MDDNKDDKTLCRLSSLILLQIIEKHINMDIQYWEQAIIKKFNQVLKNIEVFDKSDESDELNASSPLDSENSVSSQSDENDIIGN